MDQIVEHWESNDLLPDYQSAYRKNRSCETVLLKLVNDLLWSFEEGEVSGLVAIDLSAAFDTVSHSTLLDVLGKHFGMRDTVNEWIGSYLRPREMKVVTNEKFSTPRDLPFSVPQGSLLGPFLYLAYASPMEDVVPNGIDIYGFADDHGLRDRFKPTPVEERESLNRLQNCLSGIKSWMDSARLQMNCDKTEFIKFGSSKQLKKTVIGSINVCDTDVHVSDCIRYLGAWLDMHLNFRKHISIKCKAATLNLLRLKTISKSLDKETLTTLVVALVISHLDYANCILSNLPKKDIRLMQRVQNMAAKLICNKSKYDSNTECLKHLHWLPIEYHIKYKNLCAVYKCLNDKGPRYLKNLLS